MELPANMLTPTVCLFALVRNIKRSEFDAEVDRSVVGFYGAHEGRIRECGRYGGHRTR